MPKTYLGLHEVGCSGALTSNGKQPSK